MMHIVAATDFSLGSDRALQRARMLARQFSGSLVLIHVLEASAETRDPQPCQDVRVRLAATLTACQAAGDLPCSARVAIGDTAEELAGLAGALSADLLVIGPHVRRPLRDLIGSWTATRIVRQAVCPVMIANAQPLAPHRRLLLACDFSEAARAAVDVALSLVPDTESEILLYHAFDPLPYGGVAVSGMDKAGRLADLAALQHAADISLADFAKAAGIAQATRFAEPLKASAATMILAHAAQMHADLIVVGTTGKSATERFILGSVAEELMRQTVRDLLLVPRSG